jgi:hypothetical protein
MSTSRPGAAQRAPAATPEGLPATIADLRSSRDLESSCPVEADDDLRYYWAPGLRTLAVFFLLFEAFVLLIGVAGAADSASWWIVGVFIALAIAVGGRFAYQAWRSGVRETPEGLVGRVGSYTSSYPWSNLTGFGYAKVAWKERVMVDLADGSRVVVRGARRQMRWQGGETSDFAATLEERRQLLGAKNVALDSH